MGTGDARPANRGAQGAVGSRREHRGTARWPAGTAVTLPTIFGHRDSGFTECPGNVAYAQLDRFRNRVAQLAGDWRTSPINQKWQALGGDNWYAGGVSEVESDLAPGGRTTRFSGGNVQITWQVSAGAHWLSGALRQRLADAGGPGSALGFPTSDQTPTPGQPGQYVLFGPNKALFWGPQTGVHLVSDRFLAEQRARGDVAVYGLPQTEQLPVPGRGEAYQQFERSSPTPATSTPSPAWSGRTGAGSAATPDGSASRPATSTVLAPRCTNASRAGSSAAPSTPAAADAGSRADCLRPVSDRGQDGNAVQPTYSIRAPMPSAR